MNIIIAGAGKVGYAVARQLVAEGHDVALLDADTTRPILKEEGDWLIISLRGAVGWVQK